MPIFSSKFKGIRRPRSSAVQPQTDLLSDLRLALEVMPSSRKFAFTPEARAEILAKLYSSFMGKHPQLFMLAWRIPQVLLSEYQVSAASSSGVGAGLRTGADKETKDPVVPGRPCDHIFSKGEHVYWCKDCSLDDGCVLCTKCFHATDHSSHNVIVQQSGGVCDCGNEELWKNSLACPYHPPSPDPEELAEVFKAGPHVASRPLPRDIPPVQNYPFRAEVPDDLRTMMHRTIGFVLDYILDTMDYSPDEPGPPLHESDLRLLPTADPLTKDQYCVIVWSDDKHCYDELIKMLCDLTNRTREEALEVIQRIDDVGREIIDMSTNVSKLYEMAMLIAQIDLGVTIRRSHDTFCEQVVSVLIEWLADLTCCKLGTDDLVIKEIIAAELLSPRKKGMGYPINTRSPLYIDDPSPSRIDALFLYHTRLWKISRLQMEGVYITVTSLSKNHKLAIAGHFANVYHRIINAYLLVDREAETSIRYFAFQLFTVPSVAGHVVKNHNLITRLLNIICSFFTNQISEKHIQYQTSYTGPLDVESYPFKSKRFMPVFSDLRYLYKNEPVQEMIARNGDFIVQFAKICQLFMCVNPNKRPVTSHVEDETDAWISIFDITLSLSRVIKAFGEAFIKASTMELVSAIQHIIRAILLVVTLAEDRLDKAKFTPIELHWVYFGGASYHIVKFDVLEGWVSFHNSLHWLLAELLKHTKLLSKEALGTTGYKDLRCVFLEHASEEAILTIVDFPLRVFAMVAQISSGLWFCNGHAIRGQLLRYRENMFQELCYDQDLYILQTSLVLVDPNTIFVTILDRFGLVDYFSGVTTHSVFETQQLSSMVEELLHVLIVILSEDANPQRMSVEGAVRREIVHVLAMGPCTFSDVVKRLAERFTADASFERILLKVANFKPAEMETESGLYELKDEVYSEVDPFFYHYTRNEREEVETVLKARLRKKTGSSDPVILPRRFGVSDEDAMFGRLTEAFEKEVLVQIMFYSLENVLKATDSSGSIRPSAEAILDQALHLVMLGIVERGDRFARLTASMAFNCKVNSESQGTERTLLDVICTLEHHGQYKLYHSRAAWILNELEKHIFDEVKIRRVVSVAFETPIICQEDLSSSPRFSALTLNEPSGLLREQPDISSSCTNEVVPTPSCLEVPMQNLALNSEDPTLSQPQTVRREVDLHQQCTALATELMTAKAPNRHISELTGDKAQHMADFLSKMLKNQDHFARRERRHTLHLLSKLAKSAQIFPQSMELEGVQCNLTKHITAGGYGFIYKGTHDGGLICVKAVHIDSRGIDRTKLRLHASELTLWGHLSHPNVLPFLGIYPSDEEVSRICIVSPWMNNGDLLQYLETTPGVPRKLLAGDIMSGLLYLHDFDIIHADLKARNVLVSETGRAMVTDFGASRLSMTLTATSTNVAVGTAYWMAPELLLDYELPTRESDIWAFGCTCYEIITGMTPFGQYHTFPQLRHAFRKGNIVPLKSEEPGIGWDEDVWSIVKGCLQRDPESRPGAQELFDIMSNFNCTDERPSDPEYQTRRKIANIDYNRIMSILDEIRKAVL